jgi:hypothetical protein
METPKSLPDIESEEEISNNYLTRLLEKAYSKAEDTELEYYSEDSWGLVTIHFPEASVTLTKEAGKLSHEEIKQLVKNLKQYRDNVREGGKPDPMGMGGAGSVYEISNDFLIKESTDVSEENKALQRSHDLQGAIDRSATFPSNIRLVHSLALIEPVFGRRNEHSRKRYASSAFPHDTVYGSDDDKRISKVAAYIVMPNILNSVQLEDLLPSKREGKVHVVSVLNKLLEDKIIESTDEGVIKNFIVEQTGMIIRVFREAQEDVPDYERARLMDLSPRNILVRLESNESKEDSLVYYKIDH